MKRKCPILFIILAGIVVLAHALIPHHHHNKFLVNIVGKLDTDLVRILDHSHNINSPKGFHVSQINDTASFIFIEHSSTTSSVKEDGKKKIATRPQTPPKIRESGFHLFLKSPPYRKIFLSKYSGSLFGLRAPPCC